MYYASGKVEKRSYEKGELNGPATITWPSGDVFEFSYNGGKMEVRLCFVNQKKLNQHTPGNWNLPLPHWYK